MKMERKWVWPLLGLLALASQTCGQFWYGTDGPVSLVVDSSLVLVKFDEGFSPDDQASLLRQVERIVAVVNDPEVVDEFIACSLSTGTGYNAFLDSVQAIDGIYMVEPYFRSAYGDPMVAGERFCVAFNPDLTLPELDSLNEEFKVTTDREVIGLPNTFVLRNADSTGYRLLEMTNLYHELPETRYAHPDFHASIDLDGFYKLYDYYNGYQLHLTKVVGQFNSGPTVWDFAGVNKPIIVAILDDGVAVHEDLPASRILPGHDVSYPHDNDPSPGPTRAHGMGCAGIVAATHTIDTMGIYDPNTGLFSIDPYASILPLKIFNDDGSDYGIYWSDIAEAIGYAWTHGAAVLSNSWNAAKINQPPIPVLEDALRAAFLNGRNGLGCPVVFSAGNFGDYYPNVIAYPAKLDSCFAVGAATLDDTLWYYSCRGVQLDISAPSSDICLQGNLWTLDQMGWAGFNASLTKMCDISFSWLCPDTADDDDRDYDCRFGGTSAACPQGAATAALLLSRDSTLTAQEVYDVLRYSAFGAPPPPDSSKRDTLDHGWGRLDAFRALLAVTRGDVNNDGAIKVGDPVWLFAYLFRGGPPPVIDIAMGDANCDGGVNIGDVVYLTTYLFRGGPAPGVCFNYDY